MDFAPDFSEIIKSRTDNTVFLGIGVPGNDAKVTLITEVLEDNTFKISLQAERKRDHKSIRLETRIAIERHLPKKGHHLPHLQFDNINTGEIFKAGTLHIILLPENQGELDSCCRGFVYSIHEILGDIKKFFGIKEDLCAYFFYPDNIETFKTDKVHLQNMIYKSFKETQIEYEKETIRLIDYRGRKNEEMDISNPIRLFALFMMMKVPHNIIMFPMARLILETPRMKHLFPDMPPEEFISRLLGSKTLKLEHLSEENLIKELS